MITLPSKVPLFASNEKRRGAFIVYYDNEGYPACCNFVVNPATLKRCSICGNNCVIFIVDDRTGEYTCSACGKFPREILLS